MQVVGITRSVLCLQNGSSGGGVSSRECRRCDGEDEDALFMESLQSENLQTVAPLVHEQSPVPARPCVDARCKASSLRLMQACRGTGSGIAVATSSGETRQ